MGGGLEADERIRYGKIKGIEKGAITPPHTLKEEGCGIQPQVGCGRRGPTGSRVGKGFVVRPADAQ